MRHRYLTPALVTCLVAALSASAVAEAMPESEAAHLAQAQPKSKAKPKGKAPAKRPAKNPVPEASADATEGETTAVQASGVALHASQGTSRPYRGEIMAALFRFHSTSEERDVKDAEAGRFTSTGLALDAAYLFRLAGRFGIGPLVKYETRTEKTTTASSGTQAKMTELGFGLAGKVYFFDIDRDPYVPYGLVQVASSTHEESYASMTYKRTRLLVDGEAGLNVFMAPGAALGLGLRYAMANGESRVRSDALVTRDESTRTAKDSELALILGLSAFL